MIDKLEYYYYEMVLMLRKVFVVAVTVLLQTAGPENQVPTAILWYVNVLGEILCDSSSDNVSLHTHTAL